MSAIETFGEVLPGMVIEAVADPCQPGQLLLDTWNGRQARITETAEYDGRSYIPRKLPPGLAEAVRFACPSSPFGSTTDLVSLLQELLSTHAYLHDESKTVLVAFGLASWLIDALPVAPLLHLFGPLMEVSQVLRLLGCFCRRPVLLSDIDLGSLATLPERMGATFLVNQRNLGRGVRRALLASHRRHFCLGRGRRRLDMYGAKAFACDGTLADEPGLTISLSPAPNPLPFLTDADEKDIARNLQSKLLRHRMANFERVYASRVDTGAFVPEMREQAHSWLAPICDLPELTKGVSDEILRQGRERAGSRFVDPRCLVVEAALFFCHQMGTEHFLVGELADYVNLLLEGRHEEPNVSAKKAGLVLRELGVQSERVTEGFRIVLSDVTRRSIHELAFEYKVLSQDDGVPRCGHCRNANLSRSP